MITAVALVFALTLVPSETYAFGAGQIPENSRLHDKAYRHGDIENVLSEVAKTSVSPLGSSGGSVFGLAQVLLSAERGSSNFTSDDVKRVYFGNWLRDSSQAMDVAALSKLSGDTIVSIMSVLGFVAFGTSSGEFEVTKERLGVYLPVEHVDNPRGYAQGGDARYFDPRLRAPVDPVELDIDPETGMKNYLATEGRTWDTSTAYIRRAFRAAIDFGRRAQGQDGLELWEAYRLLGSGLHTMEDFLAHSNWCELALRKMGHGQVFSHVGDNVLVNTPNGPAPPLITGTFGGADFLHSLKGEISDRISQSVPASLPARLEHATSIDIDTSILRAILNKIPTRWTRSWSGKLAQADKMLASARAYKFDSEEIIPPHARRQIQQLLMWRDEVYRDVLKQVAKVPGLKGFVRTLEDALDQFVYSVLAPYLTPALKRISSLLDEASKAIMDSTHSEQYVVFDDPDASDPSHSFLSKDQFALILNQPAGRIATVVVKHTVDLIVGAWYNNTQNPDRVIDQILEAFHHPYYNIGHSSIQQQMYDELEGWLTSLGPEIGGRVVDVLDKASVKAGRNKWQQVLQESPDQV